MRVDLIHDSAGYVGIYLDGELSTWNDDEPFSQLEEAVEGQTITSFRNRNLGSYGDMAVCTGDPPDRFEDIPPIWWTDAFYGEDDYLAGDE